MPTAHVVPLGSAPVEAARSPPNPRGESSPTPLPFAIFVIIFNFEIPVDPRHLLDAPGASLACKRREVAGCLREGCKRREEASSLREGCKRREVAG